MDRGVTTPAIGAAEVGAIFGSSLDLSDGPSTLRISLTTESEDITIFFSLMLFELISTSALECSTSATVDCDSEVSSLCFPTTAAVAGVLSVIYVGGLLLSNDLSDSFC